MRRHRVMEFFLRPVLTFRMRHAFSGTIEPKSRLRCRRIWEPDFSLSDAINLDLAIDADGRAFRHVMDVVGKNGMLYSPEAMAFRDGALFLMGYSDLTSRRMILAVKDRVAYLMDAGSDGRVFAGASGLFYVSRMHMFKSVVVPVFLDTEPSFCWSGQRFKDFIGCGRP